MPKDAMQTQRDEFDAAETLARYTHEHAQVAVVDDDYPMVRHRYETALANFLAAMKANKRFGPANRYGLRPDN